MSEDGEGVSRVVGFFQGGRYFFFFYNKSDKSYDSSDLLPFAAILTVYYIRVTEISPQMEVKYLTKNLEIVIIKC